MGAKDDHKSRAKETVGNLTGDEDLEAEGKADRHSGEAKQKVGEAKEKVEELVEAVKDKVEGLIDKTKDTLHRK